MSHTQPNKLPVLDQRGRDQVQSILGRLHPARDGFCPVSSLYIHIPFCFHKCHYCDFYSLVDTRDRQSAFVARLERELAALAAHSQGAPIQTIFVGGGTPSLLRVDLWKSLLATLHRHFDLSLIDSAHGEFTVECNPETVTRELMDTLRAGGVNRVSMGAQSFNPIHLKTLERWHEPASVARAIDLARAAGIARQSIDLIFAVPGQSLADWQADLRAALSLGTEHVSCYNLTYEPATALTARLHRGEFKPLDEDLEVQMYAETLRTMRAAGFDRYEVSNYAMPGAECRHNLVYWRQGQWLAAGPSASAHVAGHRWKNVPRLDDYLEREDSGFAFAIDHEPPDAARLIREKIMTGLRLREGLDAESITDEAEVLAPGSRAELERRVAQRVASGQLLETGGRWTLTDDGMLFADAIAGELMRAVRGATA